MKRSRNIFALALALFAVVFALTALPARANAEETTIEVDQTYFNDNGGTLHLAQTSDPNDTLTVTVKLKEDVEGNICLGTMDDDVFVIIDLNGHKITGPADSTNPVIYYEDTNGWNNKTRSLRIKNGTIEQKGDSEAIRINAHPNIGSVYLTELTVTATNHDTVNCITGTVYIDGGSYTTSHTGDHNESCLSCQSTMWVNNGTVITIEGGDNVIASSGRVWLRDCKLSEVPAPYDILPVDGYTYLKPVDGYCEVVPANYDLRCREDCNWYMYYNRPMSFTSYRDIFLYFESKEECQAYADKHSEFTFKGIFWLNFTVTFNPDNGEDVKKVAKHWGSHVSASDYGTSDPTNDPYIFNGWKDNGADFDWSTRQVEGDFTLTASWSAPAATINGKGYATLEAAVEAASTDDTIVLFRDVTRTEPLYIEDKGGLTIDLNGHTLTNSESGDAIVIEGSRVSITDSSSEGTGKIDCTTGCVWVKSGAVSIDGGTYTSDTVPVTVTSGSLAITGGTIATTIAPFDVQVNSGAYCRVSGGNIQNYIGVSSDSDLSVTGGSFGTDTNKNSVANGYHMAMGSDGRYTVSAHTWGDCVYNGNGTHGRTCSVCGAKDTSDCWGTIANCTTGRVCLTCGGVYTDKDSSNHVGQADEWSTSEKKHWKACTGCGDVYPGTEAEHTWTWVTDSDATTTSAGSMHQECSVCGYKSGESATIPVVPSNAPAISGIVEGLSYDGTTKFTVTDEDDDLVSVTAGGKELKANDDGSYTLPYGENIAVVATDKAGHTTKLTVSSYKDHDWTAWTSLDGTHERACKHDGCTVKTQTGECSGGTATCTSQKVCDVCGGEYGETDPENHTGLSEKYEYDDDAHWRHCSDCGAYEDGGDHQLEARADDDYTWLECTVCGYVTDKTKKDDSGSDTDPDDKGDDSGKDDPDDKGDSEDGGKSDDGDSGEGDDSGSDDSPSDSKSDSSKKAAATIPATGDPAALAQLVALGGTAVTAFGLASRRKR